MKKSRLWGPAPLGEGTVGLAPINPPLILVCYSAGFDTTSSDAEFYSFYLQDVKMLCTELHTSKQKDRKNTISYNKIVDMQDKSTHTTVHAVRNEYL